MSGAMLAWLREQVDEDERVARKNTGEQGLGIGYYPDYRTYGGPDIDAADEFIGHFTPSRLLAEVDAKREILAQYEAIKASVDAAGGATPADATKVRLGAYEKVLRFMALPYEDRPGRDQAWEVCGS